VQSDTGACANGASDGGGEGGRSVAQRQAWKWSEGGFRPIRSHDTSLSTVVNRTFIFYSLLSYCNTTNHPSRNFGGDEREWLSRRRPRSFRSRQHWLADQLSSFYDGASRSTIIATLVGLTSTTKGLGLTNPLRVE
jgi:hypothetical protein